MKIYNVEQIVVALRDRKKPLHQIAAESGVPMGTIRKLLNTTKPVRNPRIDTFQKLARYCESEAA